VKTLCIIMLTALATMLSGQNLPAGQEGVDWRSYFDNNHGQDPDHDMDSDFSSLDDLEQDLQNHPVNLAVRDPLDLLRLSLISREAADSIYRYMLDFGPMLSLYELAAVGGINREMAGKLLPFVCLRPQSSLIANIKNAIQRPHAEILLSCRRVLEKKAGYCNDTAVIPASQQYQGDANQYKANLKFGFGKNFTAAVALRKDPGESGPDEKQPLNFDDKASYVAIQDIGSLKKAVIGNFGFSAGQGLTLGSYSGSGNQASDFRFQSRGLYPLLSQGSHTAFRGAGLSLLAQGITLSVFLSQRKRDAGTDTNAENPDHLFYTSLGESNYHRTVSEVMNKGRIIERNAGLHLSGGGELWRTGFSVLYHQTEGLLIPSHKAYRLFQDTNSRMVFYGFDWQLFLRKIRVFGEVSLKEGIGPAMTAGFNCTPEPRLSISFSLCMFPAGWSNPQASAICNNIYGMPLIRPRATLNIILNRRMDAGLYVDYNDYRWLRYNVSLPLPSLKRNVFLHARLPGGCRLDLSAGWSDDHSDLAGNTPTDTLIANHRFFFKIKTQLQISKMCDYEILCHYQLRRQNGIGRGFLISQKLAISQINKNMKMICSISLFDTDTYADRIYAWEDDLYRSITIGMFMYRGWQLLGVMQISLNPSLKMRLKLSRITYPDKVKLGSGAEESKGNSRTTLAVQLQYNL